MERPSKYLSTKEIAALIAAMSDDFFWPSFSQILWEQLIRMTQDGILKRKAPKGFGDIATDEVQFKVVET